MSGPLDAIPAITHEHTSPSHEDELTVLRARVAQLEQESAEQKWLADAINALAFATASGTGKEFLQGLVQQLAATLEVQYVFVTEWVPGRTDKIRTVAGWGGDRAADPVEYELSHTPCQKVLQDGEAFFAHHVQQLFPRDEYLVEHSIESYMGVSLLDSAGRPSGHLCIMDVRPFLFDRSRCSAIIRIFAERAAAELARHRAEVTLRHSEARMNRFVAEAPVGLVIFDENKRVINANKAFCELTGYAEHEILGTTYELYTHPEDLPANLALTEEFYRGVRSEYTLEKRYIRKSGEIIWVSVKASRVELPGHPGPLQLAAIQDITEQKLAMEEREKLSQDLHDNILQSLYAVGMQLEAAKLVMGKAPRQSKAHMTQAIDQLNHLMLDVRQFITLLTQRTSVKLDFGQALRQLVASFSPSRRAAVDLEITDPVLSLITSQQGEHLLNIVRESLSNSMRHAQATHRSVRLDHRGNKIRLVICDDGIGFPARRHRHRGHGLANMAARAKKIRARFTLDSAPGKGTCIMVEVPVEKGPTLD
ncbi:MAG: PAS domain-containing sensor histidine kinase [Nitrospiraceae bacterium]